MTPIPPKLRAELEADPYYKRCAITGRTNEKIEWHHNMIYAGRQLQQKFAIIPLAQSVHERIIAYKEICDWIMVNRATTDELKRYSKAIDYVDRRERLNKKFGVYDPNKPLKI